MTGKYDDMNFGKAFAAARKEKGAGKTFTWKGKSYTTNYKEEAKKPAKKTAKKTAPKSSARPKTKPKGEITTRRLTPVKDQGRGDGRAETDRRRTDALIDMADKAIRSLKSYSYKEWKSMSRAERKAAGLPVSVIGGELGFKRFKTGLTGKDYKMTPGAAPKPKPASTGSRGRNRGRTGAAKGGMMKKKAKK